MNEIKSEYEKIAKRTLYDQIQVEKKLSFVDFFIHFRSFLRFRPIRTEIIDERC